MCWSIRLSGRRAGFCTACSTDGPGAFPRAGGAGGYCLRRAGGLPRGRPGIFSGAGAGGASAGRAADGRPFCWAPRATRPPSAPGACRAGTCWRQPLQALRWQSTCWGFRCGPWAGCCAGRWMGWQNTPRPMPRPVPPAKRRPKNAGTKKDLQKNRKRTCQVSGACCIIQTYQSKSTGAKSLLYVRGLTL